MTKYWQERGRRGFLFLVTKGREGESLLRQGLFAVCLTFFFIPFCVPCLYKFVYLRICYYDSFDTQCFLCQ
jgi:hypothetical protein